MTLDGEGWTTELTHGQSDYRTIIAFLPEASWTVAVPIHEIALLILGVLSIWVMT